MLIPYFIEAILISNLGFNNCPYEIPHFSVTQLNLDQDYYEFIISLIARRELQVDGRGEKSTNQQAQAPLWFIQISVSSCYLMYI